jgi:pimeloyl-ACP methyl ester carboxylesterase
MRLSPIFVTAVIMTDLVFQALTELLPCQLRRGELKRPGRTLRWIEAGSGRPAVVLEAALGEPGSLAYAGVMAAVAARTRIIAYDRAGLGTSDPADELTLEVQVGDLAAVAAHADGPCVLAGHSWGGLLVLLAAAQHAEVICGLVLIDPADEIYWAGLPAEIHRESSDLGAMFLEQHASGELAGTVRESFGPYVARLTGDEQLRTLLLDAYVWCYAKRYQAAMIQGETDLFMNSISRIHQIRSSRPLPDVPTVVLSATTGAAPENRAKWTRVHAELAASLPRATHLELPDTHHAINEFRPQAITDAITQVLAAI